MDNFVVKNNQVDFIVQIADFSESKFLEGGINSVSIRGNMAHLSPEFRYALLNEKNYNFER